MSSVIVNNLSGITFADAECMIYTELMRQPQFVPTVDTWQQACAHADKEMPVLRGILASDLMILHKDAVHDPYSVDVTRLPSMHRFVRSSVAYYFGRVRQIIVRRKVIEAIQLQCPLRCTEPLEDELAALETALGQWTDELRQMFTCVQCRMHCAEPVPLPCSPTSDMAIDRESLF